MLRIFIIIKFTITFLLGRNKTRHILSSNLFSNFLKVIIIERIIGETLFIFFVSGTPCVRIAHVESYLRLCLCESSIRSAKVEPEARHSGARDEIHK